MYWVKNQDDTFEVLDGQQRTISICEYVKGTFSIDFKYFHNLTDDEREEILDYKYALDESSFISITNHKGIISYVNDNFYKISKYSSEELIGQDHRILNSGHHAKEYIKELKLKMKNAYTVVIEITNDNGGKMRKNRR